ncbi:prestin-like isoform X3 [Littorina saxatilis]|uniref:prestin-like isoform X3 n=1 Tax=Littorina saxatilis TaxID=31220 RepID=UPI0038B58FAF
MASLILARRDSYELQQVDQEGDTVPQSYTDDQDSMGVTHNITDPEPTNVINGPRRLGSNGNMTSTTTATATTGTVNPAYSSDEDNYDDTSNNTTAASSVFSDKAGRIVRNPAPGVSNEVVLSVRRLLSSDLYGARNARLSMRSACTRRSWASFSSIKGQRTGSEDDDNDDRLTVDEMVVVERPILTEFDFEQGFERHEKAKRNPLTWAKKKANKCVCSCACFKGFLMQVFPFLRLLRGYSIKSDFPADIIAGLTVGIMHIPQGMAYGQLSTLPPVYGLYVSFFPVILYFFLGTSKHVSVGTFAVVSLMVGSAVDKGLEAKGIAPKMWNETAMVNGSVTYTVMNNDAEMLQAKLGLAMAVTFAVGCVQLLLGLLRLGFLTVYLSDPLVSGFTTGAACHVFTSQIKHIFGVEIGRYGGPFKLIKAYRDFFTNIPTSNSVTLIASIVCILLLVFVKEYINNNPKIKPRLIMPVPIELIVVVLGTVISYFVKLEEKYDVKIVGEVPVGIPPPSPQQFLYLKDVISDSIALGIVAFAISVSMAKILAQKHDYEIDSNQELVAYGVVNVTCSFFSSFVAAASLSRSLVQDNTGGKTQVAGLISSALLLVVLLVLGSYFKTLPNCILAAIIVVALKGMFKQFAELKRLWNISIIDFLVWLVSFLGTVLLDVDLGLLVGIIFALLTVIIRQQRPKTCLLGQIPGTDLYKDMGTVKAAEELEHIKIFRFESALFFANTEYFKTSIYKMTADPSVLKKLKRKAEKELMRVQVVPRKSTVAALQGLNVVNGETPIMPSDPDSVDPKRTDNNAPTANGGNTEPAADDTDVPPDTNLTGEEQEDFSIVLPTVTDVYFIIIDCTTMGYVDSVGVKVLQQVIMEMRNYSIQVFFASCKEAVREMFEKTSFYSTSDKQCLFLTVHDAVLYAQRILAIVEADEADGQSKGSLESIQEHSITGSTEHRIASGNGDVFPPANGNGSSSKP